MGSKSSSYKSEFCFSEENDDKKENPDLRIPTKQVPYFLSLLVSIFHPRISLSWARTHLGKRLFWDSSPAEQDLGMEWRSPEQSLLETVTPVIENDWIG